MSSGQPLADLVLWLRALGAILPILGLPGWLLVGRLLRGCDAATRVVLSLCAGLLAAAALGTLCSTLGIPVAPLSHLFGVGAAALLAPRSARWRAGVQELAQQLGPLRRLEHAALCVAATIALGGALVAQHDWPAPPHVHDASNHAYLAGRVAEVASLEPAELFAGEPGRPAVLYLAGWHGAAALVARVSGVAPYICVWFLVLLALAATPISLAALWRLWGLPAQVAALGALFVASNQLMPSGALKWGGFGQIFGFLLVAPAWIVVRRLLARPSLGVGALAGLCLGAQLAIHGSELLVIAILLFAFPGRRASWCARHLAAAAVCLLVMAVLTGPPTLQLTLDYARLTDAMGASERRTIGDALERLLSAGGKPAAMKALTLLGLGLALARPQWRRAGLLMLVLAAYYLAAAVAQDALSQWLATPFYRQAPRILYLQIYVLPALMALPLFAAAQRLNARVGQARAPLLAFALALLVCASAWPGQLRSLRGARSSVPFSESSYRLARELESLVPADALIANFWDDGSTWAAQISGRRFLQPCSWRLYDDEGPLRGRVEGLLMQPWPETTRALQRLGARHLWISRLVWPDPGALPASVERIDTDPRFVALRREADAVLYEILWEREP